MHLYGNYQRSSKGKLRHSWYKIQTRKLWISTDPGPWNSYSLGFLICISLPSYNFWPIVLKFGLTVNFCNIARIRYVGLKNSIIFTSNLGTVSSKIFDLQTPRWKFEKPSRFRRKFTFKEILNGQFKKLQQAHVLFLGHLLLYLRNNVLGWFQYFAFVDFAFDFCGYLITLYLFRICSNYIGWKFTSLTSTCCVRSRF